MKQRAILPASFLIILNIIISCNKNNSAGSGGTNPPPPPTGPTILKDASSIPVGVGISYDLMKNNATYSALVRAQFDRVTAEYQMKHGANVKNDGSIDFTRTDDFFAITQAVGLMVHGHTLAWHANNNGTYLRSLSTAQQVKDA